MTIKTFQKSDNTAPLAGINIFISASIPEELSGSPRAQGMFMALQLLTRQIAAKGGDIVFGGHPSVTPLIHRAVRDLERKKCFHLYQLNMFRKSAPPEALDEHIFHDVVWMGDENGEINVELGHMRDRMAEHSQAAVFIGGRTPKLPTEIGGVRDEFQRFQKLKPGGAAYLLGFMAGETLNIISQVEQSGEKENNALTPEELEYIHHSDNIDLVVSLVVTDLVKFFSRKQDAGNSGE